MVKHTSFIGSGWGKRLFKKEGTASTIRKNNKERHELLSGSGISEILDFNSFLLWRGTNTFCLHWYFPVVLLLSHWKIMDFLQKSLHILPTTLTCPVHQWNYQYLLSAFSLIYLFLLWCLSFVLGGMMVPFFLPHPLLLLSLENLTSLLHCSPGQSPPGPIKVQLHLETRR